ncbi:MAG: hypothetical protein IJV89_00220 [Lentisphaeria bacterium]|nr:hypothetical protein [Lentisphaeria bacterium]
MKNSEQEFSLQQLEMAIDAARMCGAGCFSVQDVLAKLPGAKKDAVLENRILRMLDADEALFRDGEDVFCGKAEFFTGKTFLITPDSFEISQGILVPGHRTAAFVSPEVFPSEVEMTDGESQNIFEMKDFSADLDMIYNYYLLLGSEQLMDYLTADHPDNAGLISGNGGQKATICVYDMADFYKAHDFQPGDALICTVKDWQNGKISIQYLAAADRKNGTDWDDAFTAALEDVIQNFEHYFDIPEQLAWGFFYGRNALFGKPEKMLSCDEFIRKTDRIEITYQEDHTVLTSCSDDFDTDSGFDHDDHCSCGDEHHHHHHNDIPEEVRISRGETEDFAKLLRELGLFLTPVEVDSYILDSCSFRAPDYDDFFRRCFGGTDLNFADDAQEAVFHNMVEERWETFTANYDRESDTVKAELRGSILEILDEKIAFLNSVENPESLAATEMRRLAEISIYLDEVLRLLNSPKHELKEDEAEEMAEKVADLADTQTAVIEKLQN